jgi:AmmeMemoRadiSam system protein A
MKGRVTVTQGSELLKLARQTLEHRLGRGDAVVETQDPELLEQGAAFVTLKLDGKLRGCIGNLVPVSSLWLGVRDNALNAALHDHRFKPLSIEELDKVVLDISVLSAPQPLEYEGQSDLLQKLRPDIDGVILRKDRKGATFLPQVWEQLPRPEQFLDHLCVKAGLPQGEWREGDLEIKTYQVQCFHEGKR